MRRFVLLMLLVLALVPAALPAPAAAQARERCFPETGYCISGRILAYWERNGGLPVFGYPIGPLQETEVISWFANPITKWKGPAQWFERDRLEDHSADGQGVMAGLLGREMILKLAHGAVLPIPEPVASAPPGCRFFPETGHSLCEPFLSAWRRGGLERYGYPITEAMTQTIGGWTGTVQYFERRRMELHPELPGSPVLLGLLGRELYEGVAPGCPVEVAPEVRQLIERTAFFSQMGCPRPVLRDVAAAEQFFEYGVMLYVAAPRGDAPGRIYAVRHGMPVIHRVYSDTWAPGQPERGGETPPDGLIEPSRGFGAVWRGDPWVRSWLRWATQPERAERALFQEFDGGAVLYLSGTRAAYVFGPNGVTTRWTGYD